MITNCVPLYNRSDSFKVLETRNKKKITALAQSLTSDHLKWLLQVLLAYSFILCVSGQTETLS